MTKDLIIANTKLNWKLTQSPGKGVRKEVMPRAEPKSQHIVIRPRQTEVTAVAVNQILRDTADYFEKGAKWCQGGIGNNIDEACLVGGILRQESGDIDNVYYETQPQRHPLTTAAVAKLSQYLNKPKALPPPDPSRDLNFTHVSAWNDMGGRSKAEVVELLREAADECPSDRTFDK